MQHIHMSFLSGSVVKNLHANAGDVGLIPGLGSSPGEGKGNPFQYSCLGNSMGRRAWWATIHEVAKNQTQLSNRVHVVFFDVWKVLIRSNLFIFAFISFTLGDRFKKILLCFMCKRVLPVFPLGVLYRVVLHLGL